MSSDTAPAKTPKALTIYTDLPLAGSSGAIQTSIANGARLALEQWDHRVSYGSRGHLHSIHVYLHPLNDADARTGNWSQDLTAANAQYAASKPTTVAYIGDFDSAATAISLQAISPTGILQVSPWSPYIGFTDANPADGQGRSGALLPRQRPEHLRAAGALGLAEAAATVQYMRATRRDAALRARRRLGRSTRRSRSWSPTTRRPPGITVVGLQQGDRHPDQHPAAWATPRSPRPSRPQRPDAVLLGGKPGAGARRAVAGAAHDAAAREAVRAEHAGDADVPQRDRGHDEHGHDDEHQLDDQHHLERPARARAPARVRAPARARRTSSSSSTAATSPATRATSAASATYVTSPILEPYQYPAAAWVVLADYRRRFKTAPTAYALYGYAAMHDVLLAIKRAGAAGGRPPGAAEGLLPPPRRDRRRARPLHDQRLRRQLAAELRRLPREPRPAGSCWCAGSAADAHPRTGSRPAVRARRRARRLRHDRHGAGRQRPLSATTLTVYSDLPLLGADAAQTAEHRQRRGAGALRRRRPRRQAAREPRVPRLTPPTRSQAGTTQTDPDRVLGAQRLVGPQHRRLHRRLRLGRDRDLAAAQQRERHPADQPGQHLRRLHRRQPVDFTGDPSYFYPNGVRHVRAAGALRPRRGATRPSTTCARSASRGSTCSPTTSYPPYDSSIAPLVASDAPAAGIAVVGQRSGIDTAGDHATGRLRGDRGGRRGRPRRRRALGGAAERRRRRRCGASCTRALPQREAVRAEHARRRRRSSSALGAAASATYVT